MIFVVILVDTSVWIDYFNGTTNSQSDRLDELLGSGDVLTGDLILAELLQGFTKNADFRRARQLMDSLPCVDLVGRDLAIRAAEYFRQLRRKGITVRKTIDVLIATFCISNDHALLHRDKDFTVFERHLGLQVDR
ncbi:MAG TPA: PIN domain nuclease [Steroidobacteraceae bacterium]|nr:PIN domain nuclease [Steroidobacteraceae bacterium]